MTFARYREAVRVPTTVAVKQWRMNSRIAAAWAAWLREDAELDAREDECLRMFGVSVEYYQDERIISHA